MTAVSTSTSGLDAGAYEVLRARLAEQAAGLARSTEALNAQRVETFGSTALELVATERIRTENNRVPRDIVAPGDVLLFGYNVFMGLKPETSVNDVFAVLGRDFGTVEASFLQDPRFRNDFAELYRYYRDTRSEEHTSELQSPCHLVCRLLLEK